MSPHAQKIIDDLKARIETDIDTLINLVQEEAVNEMIAKLAPTKAKVRLIKERVQIPLEPVVTPIQEDDETEEEPGPTLTKYANPADDPMYGMLGSGCYSSGRAGGVVTEVEDEQSEPC
jgi:hypothetical protein